MSITVEAVGFKDPKTMEIAMIMDSEGIDFLVAKLQKLRGKLDHCHLMTSAWGGSELETGAIGGSDAIVVNHLRLVCLPKGQ